MSHSRLHSHVLSCHNFEFSGKPVLSQGSYLSSSSHPFSWYGKSLKGNFELWDGLRHKIKLWYGFLIHKMFSLNFTDRASSTTLRPEKVVAKQGFKTNFWWQWCWWQSYVGDGLRCWLQNHYVSWFFTMLISFST